MPVKNGPTLHLEKIHAHAFGNMAVKEVLWETNAEAAGDTIKLLPLQPGMRIHQVITFVEDASSPRRPSRRRCSHLRRR